MTVHDSKCPELPAPPGRILLFGLAALVLGAGLAYLLRHPQRPECVGVLAVHSTVVSASIDGMLAEIVAQEGDQVQVGTPLARLVDTDLQREIAIKVQEVATLDRELQQATARAALELQWRLKSLNAEICDVQLRSAGFLKEQYDYELKRNYYADLIGGDDLALLGGTGTLDAVLSRSGVSQAEKLTAVMHMEAAANAAEVSAAQVEICEQQVRRLEELKAKLPEQVRSSTEVDVAEARLKMTQAELDNLRSRADDLVVTAPAIGRVGVFKVRRGDLVKRGTALVELLDPAQRYLVAHVPSQQIGAFGEGIEVRLSFPGRVIRHGRVSNVAPQAGGGNVPIPGNDVAVLVRIEQSGELWPDVPIGSHVRVAALPQ